MSGPYVYADVADLEATDPVGTGECAVLVRHYARAPSTNLWTAGDAVKGKRLLAKGTAIATFVAGRYPNAGTGNHAALYISQDLTGILVMDQWRNKASVGARRLRFKGKDRDGRFIDPSNNGDAFSVIN